MTDDIVRKLDGVYAAVAAAPKIKIPMWAFLGDRLILVDDLVTLLRLTEEALRTGLFDARCAAEFIRGSLNMMLQEPE